MNDNVISPPRFGGRVPEPEKKAETKYRIHFRQLENEKEPLVKEVTGYLGVSPLFVAVTDEHERILFMVPHEDYAFVEAIPEEASEYTEVEEV